MEDNQEINKQPRKKTHHLFLLFWLALVVVAFVAAKYLFDEKNYQLVKRTLRTDQFSNVESQIYNNAKESDQFIASSAPNSAPAAAVAANPSADLIPDNGISKGVYSNLVKQQLEIEVLQEKYGLLKAEIERIKNQDKLSKIIIGYVELKDCIDARQNCDEKLQKLELLAKSDANLASKIEALKSILQNKPKSLNQIKSEFTALIPEIIATKPIIISQSYLDKIKYQISKLLVIRRVDGIVGKASQNIDFVIVETEKLLDKNKYQQALDLLSAQDEIYQKLLSEFLVDLQNINQLNKTTDEIFLYLKAGQNL